MAEIEEDPEVEEGAQTTPEVEDDETNPSTYAPAMAASSDEAPDSTVEDEAPPSDYQPAMAASDAPEASDVTPEAQPEPNEEGKPAAMGAAVLPAGQPASISTSPAAKSLGEFATATGTTVKAPPPTPLESLGPAPRPPTTNPELAKTEANLRAHASPTPRFGADGKIQQQYHPSVGSRIGRAVLDFTQGGIGGVARGALGDRSSPGYFGPGAVNSQYFRDEAVRRGTEAADKTKVDSLHREDTTAQRDYKNQEAAFKDDTRRAYEQTTTEERARHQQETEGLTKQLRDTQQQAADTRDQLADQKDPAKKISAEIDARTGVAQRLGLKGQAAQDYILYGDKAGVTGVSRMRLRVEEQRLGLQQSKFDKSKKDVNDLGYTADEQRGINMEAPGAMKSLSDLEGERAKNVAAGMSTAALDKDISGARQTVQDAADKVRNSRTAPVPKPGAGRPQPPPANKGTVTRQQIQAAVDKYNATNPKVKATYDGQKKNAIARGMQVQD